jgi:hypothetical protein
MTWGSSGLQPEAVQLPNDGRAGRMIGTEGTSLVENIFSAQIFRTHAQSISWGDTGQQRVTPVEHSNS